MLDQTATLDLLKFTVPFVSGAVAWLVNQWMQRSREEFLRKEVLYKELLTAVQGLYARDPATDADRKRNLILQLRVAWLYASDEVIRASNMMTDSIVTNESEAAKQQALASFIVAIRKDLKGRTQLNAADYRHVGS